MNTQEKSLICSFCSKDQGQVRKLIAGPTVYICDECVELCVEIIAEDYINNSKRSSSHQDLSELRTAMLSTAMGAGVRVSHRPIGITFDEQRPTFHMEKFTDYPNGGVGVSVGDIVWVSEQPSPWHLPIVEDDAGYTACSEKRFTVAGFVTLDGKNKGKERRAAFSCTFAILLLNNRDHSHPTHVWRGERAELAGTAKQIELVWTGALRKSPPS